MAVTLFKSTPLFKGLKCQNFQEIRYHGSGGRLFTISSSDTTGYFKSIFLSLVF